jgi:Flp pilus assembly protein TadG
MRSCSPRRCGASAVELALVLPMLSLVFVIVVDFARLYYYYSIVTNSARNAALYASGTPIDQLESPYNSCSDAALAEDAYNLSPQLTISPPYYGTDSSGNSYVRVTVTYPFTTITHYPGLPNPINLTRTVQMRMAPLTPN